MKIFKSKRGFSMTEVIIALTIITVVSAAAVSLIVASVKQQTDTINSLEIYNCAENSIEIFRFSDDMNEMLGYLKKTDGDYKISDGEIILEKDNYTVKISVDFSANKLDFDAIQKRGGKSIYSVSYEKG